MNYKENAPERLIKVIQQLITTIVVLLFAVIALAAIAIFKPDIKHWFVKSEAEKKEEAAKKAAFKEWEIAYEKTKEMKSFWSPVELSNAKTDSLPNNINYGKELIMHTAKYLGPKGSVLQISNGMNCQNCHLDAGTKVYGNNYGAVFSTYPKYRARSGQEENIYKRINDCFERSLNGKALAENSKEMQAIKSYIEYIGSNVKKGDKAKGSGIYDLPYLTRAANPDNGKKVFEEKCQSCHQQNGQGQMDANNIEYTYPPLWGQHSYNYGAGLYRNSRFAGYVKFNMPQGATYLKPQLTDEEAWDVAAFVNAQPRPSKDISKDWPKIEEKPVDHPFGPFVDSFLESQHKFGPFQPIKDAQKLLKSKAKK